MGISKYSNDFKGLCIDNQVPELVKSIKKDIYLNNDSERLLHFFIQQGQNLTPLWKLIFSPQWSCCDYS